MKTFQLNAEPRTDLGKKATKALRASGKIPCVLNGGKLVSADYNGELKAGEKVVEIGRDGKAVITTDFQVNYGDVRKLIYTPDTHIIELTLNGEVKKVVLKDVQWHKLNDTILHMDFLEVYDNKPVVVEVPIKVEGFAAGVKAGGKLYLGMKKVKVKGLWDKLPDRIIVNVEQLLIGQSIKVKDLTFDDYELASPKELVITGVRATRAAANAAVATDEEEAEGGGEAAAEAPAAE